MLILKDAGTVQKQEEPKKKKRGYRFILTMPTAKQVGWQEVTTVDVEEMSAALEAARVRTTD